MKLEKLHKPNALKRGDKIATVSLSWGGPGTFRYRYDAGKKQLEEAFGVQVVEMPHTAKPADWVARNPQARADDLMQAFSDPEIKAVFSTIGGDDSIRLIPYLDINVIKNNPKIFMGYSDTTVSHFACLKAGLASFYGPSIMSGFAENTGLFPYMTKSVQDTLFSTDKIGVLEAAEEWTDERLDWSDEKNQKIKRPTHKPLGWQFLQKTEKPVKGRLIGGCFEVVETIKSTELWPDKEIWDDAILFLEVSEEKPPEVIFQRGIRNYGAQGILHKLKGVLFGRPGGSLPVNEVQKYDEILRAVIADEFGVKNIPIISQMDFGHCDPMLVMPYGREVEINSEHETVAVLESAVV